MCKMKSIYLHTFHYGLGSRNGDRSLLLDWNRNFDFTFNFNGLGNCNDFLHLFDNK
jgi:hypothetical protein